MNKRKLIIVIETNNKNMEKATSIIENSLNEIWKKRIIEDFELFNNFENCEDHAHHTNCPLNDVNDMEGETK